MYAPLVPLSSPTNVERRNTHRAIALCSGPVLLLTVASPTFAGSPLSAPLSAGELATNCSIQPSPLLTTCMAFTRGVLDTLHSLEATISPKIRLCASLLTAEERRRIFREWVKKRSRSDLSWKKRAAADAVYRALRDTFPCGGATTPGQ